MSVIPSYDVSAPRKPQQDDVLYSGMLKLIPQERMFYLSDIVRLIMGSTYRNATDTADIEALYRGLGLDYTATRKRHRPVADEGSIVDSDVDISEHQRRLRLGPDQITVSEIAWLTVRPLQLEDRQSLGKEGYEAFVRASASNRSPVYVTYDDKYGTMLIQNTTVIWYSGLDLGSNSNPSTAPQQGIEL